MIDQYVNAKLTDFKYTYFIAMFYMTLVILCSIVGFKLIETPYHVMSGASLVCPFLFLMGDIVAEVYGYKLAMRLFVSGLICKLILVVVSYLIISLPSPPDWNHQASYDLIIGSLPKIYGYSMLGMMVSWMLNAFVLTRWKYIVQGKYFWFRSITTSGVGEILFSIISVSLTLLGTVPTHDIPSIVIWSFSLKVIFTVIFAYPIVHIVNWLKRNEGVDVYDNTTGLNPFKEITNES
jgi:uncharacterized integral membrane protein (TIGR00697 family)